MREPTEKPSTHLAVSEGLGDIGPDEWNALVDGGDPFLEYGFLAALERSGAVGEATAWWPRYITLYRGGRLKGVVPFFVRWDSQGEFIFDWQWAAAFERAGIEYYPKGVAAVPFTPATGRRILVAPGEDFAGAASAMVRFLEAYSVEQGLSSCHVLFCSEREQQFLCQFGYTARLTHQFHWLNRGYRDFEDYLASLRSKKRKQIRRERAGLRDQGIEIRLLAGDDIEEEHIEAMWRFYIANAQRPWGQAYLNRATFDALLDLCRARLVLVLACDGDEWVGGSMSFCKGPNLYGRYWGCSRFVPNLHFECCFYRLIEYAIDKELALFEAGAQGEQKFLRGFVARPTYSAHRIEHPGAKRAIDGFLAQERRHGRELIAGYNRVSPLKSVRRRG